MGFSKIYRVLCNKEFSTWGHAVTHWPLSMEGWNRTHASLVGFVLNKVELQ